MSKAVHQGQTAALAVLQAPPPLKIKKRYVHKPRAPSKTVLAVATNSLEQTFPAVSTVAAGSARAAVKPAGAIDANFGSAAAAGDDTVGARSTVCKRPSSAGTAHDDTAKSQTCRARAPSGDLASSHQLQGEQIWGGSTAQSLQGQQALFHTAAQADSSTLIQHACWQQQAQETYKQPTQQQQQQVTSPPSIASVAAVRKDLLPSSPIVMRSIFRDFQSSACSMSSPTCLLQELPLIEPPVGAVATASTHCITSSILCLPAGPGHETDAAVLTDASAGGAAAAGEATNAARPTVGTCPSRVYTAHDTTMRSCAHRTGAPPGNLATPDQLRMAQIWDGSTAHSQQGQQTSLDAAAQAGSKKQPIHWQQQQEANKQPVQRQQEQVSSPPSSALAAAVCNDLLPSSPAVMRRCCRSTACSISSPSCFLQELPILKSPVNAAASTITHHATTSSMMGAAAAIAASVSGCFDFESSVGLRIADEMSDAACKTELGDLDGLLGSFL